jgi:hypothetical protein
MKEHARKEQLEIANIDKRMGFTEEDQYDTASILPKKVKPVPPKKGRRPEKKIEQILVLDIESGNWENKKSTGKNPPMRCNPGFIVESKHLVINPI